MSAFSVTERTRPARVPDVSPTCRRRRVPDMSLTCPRRVPSRLEVLATNSLVVKESLNGVTSGDAAAVEPAKLDAELTHARCQIPLLELPSPYSSARRSCLPRLCRSATPSELGREERGREVTPLRPLGGRPAA